MLTSIGRAAAAGRVMASAPSRLAAAAKLAPQVAGRPSFHGAALPVRCLSATVWARSPAASSAGAGSGSGTKKAASGTKTKKKKATTKTAKKAVPKKPKKKAKKVLTPEEKEKAEIKELKKMALLKGPSLLPETLWSVYVADNLPSGQGKLTDKIKEVASRFSGLSEYEKDRLRTTAQSNQTANKQTRQQWIESYPPEAVYMANVARRRLARRLEKNRVYLIHDDRLPKRAGTPYTLFVKSRFKGASAAASGSSAQDTFRAMSTEWKAMSDAEKKPFQDMARDEAEASGAQLKELKDKARAYWKEHKGGSSSQVPS